MAHKLSLITEQTINSEGWNSFKGNPYNDETIIKIADNIGKTEIPVTSIPSPFAQMHLTETAFAFINRNFEQDRSIINGNTTYHKLISNCLDVFEILYKYETLKLNKRISVEIWNKSELNSLKKSPTPGVRTFAETLTVFINNYNNDSRFRNQGILNVFDEFLLIYLDNKIIAGSSPYTGFFTIGDRLPTTLLSDYNNRFFFSNNLPLYKRDVGFQKFLNIFFAKNPSIIASFEEVNKYIKLNNKINTDEDFSTLIASIDRIGVSEEGKNYKLLEINNTEVTLLGGRVVFECQIFNQADERQSARDSDYAIRSSKQLNDPPLALLDGISKGRWKYLNGTFPEDCRVTGTQPIEKRILPQTVVEYPWITRNDLLSKHLIQLEYNVNSKFWMPSGDVKNIILPVTSTYFKYFTVEDLKKQIKISKQNIGGGIEVVLEIPVKGDNGRGIQRFERIYNNVNPGAIDNDDYGAIIKSSVAFGIYPFFKVSEAAYNDRFKVLSYHKKEEDINYEFLRQSLNDSSYEKIDGIKTSRTRKEEGYPVVSDYIDISNIKHNAQGETIIESTKDITFDIISVTINNLEKKSESQGVIIPLMPEPISLGGSSDIAFDIGTSNSFAAIKTSGTIENIANYTLAGQDPQPHFVLLNEPVANEDLYRKYDLSRVDQFFGIVQNSEFMPSVVGDKSYFKLPVRSIMNIDNDVNTEINNEIIILSNANIPFAFGKSQLRRDYDSVHSNIKWGVADNTNNTAKNVLKGFIEEIAWIGRNKLLREGCHPKSANVIWFKPLSMGANQQTAFSGIWKSLYTNYFSKSDDITKLHCITESRAPYYAYDRTFGAGEVYMNIDIGGGTSDLILFVNNEPALTTSFRFAGNSLFESTSSTKPFDNGFVDKYEGIMRNELAEDINGPQVIDYIKNSKGLMASDLMSFFFTYPSFIDKLKLDSHFKLLFLVHNSAVFYHSMQVLKMSGIQKLPTYVGLSGNGARLLEITNGDNDLNRYNGLSSVLKKITKKVFELESDPKIEIQILKNPKEATAVGGIVGIDQILRSENADMENFRISLGNETDLIKENDKRFEYALFLKDDNQVISDVTNNIISFFTYFFDELWYEMNFSKNFGVENSYNTNKLKEFFTDKNKINNVLREVINYKIDVEQETTLNDSLFFEPIKAYLYAFSKIIVSDKINEFKGSR